MRLLRIEIAIAVLLLAPFAGYAIGYVFADAPATAHSALPAASGGPATGLGETQTRAVREAGA